MSETRSSFSPVMFVLLGLAVIVVQAAWHAKHFSGAVIDADAEITAHESAYDNVTLFSAAALGGPEDDFREAVAALASRGDAGRERLLRAAEVNESQGRQERAEFCRAATRR